MPFNGSGVFNRVYSWVTDKNNGLDIDSTRMDTDTNDIATGLTNCVTRDGQSPPTANLPMATFKITGLGNGTNPQDAVAVSQVKAGYTDAAFLGGSTTYSASNTWTTGNIASKYADTLTEITLGNSGNFTPVNAGTYFFSGIIFVQTSAATTGISGSFVGAALFLNGVQSSSLMTLTWPFANSLSRNITLPIAAVLALSSADVVNFKSLAVYTGTAPSFQIFGTSIRRLV